MAKAAIGAIDGPCRIRLTRHYVFGMLRGMANTIPSAEQVSATLKSLDGPQLQRLAKLSGVPLPTLVKIKHGTTPNPRIGTVFRFWPFLSVV